MTGAFDVIGDVHGYCDKLIALLSRLGYAESGSVWRHPGRTAVFVGDLIDRGPKQLATVDLVRRMVDGGAAKCIMGNHEFNAIAWVTRDPGRPQRFLRPHGKRANRKQHHAFLKEVEGSHRHAQTIAWFRTLPLWLDLGGLRVVHACWHQASMDPLQALLGPGNTITDELVLLGNQPGHWAYEAIEVVCKGPDIALPGASSFKDKEGKVRRHVRVRWWEEDVTTYRDAAIVAQGEEQFVPDVPLPAQWTGHPYSGPPVLFGHYWFSGVPAVISHRFACLDFSVAKGGPLVAYRWDGERELSSEKLVWV
ncbi:MAG TPA: metallophosphoesterase [Steroidobacteraceae bacterium]|nr:metallophosphoesterase [Steroidobacteraceae bacterium]